ncbi:molybdopterin-guanine dinucleotide biosynthesis protein MobA [Actinomyces oris]|uniref:Molybdopterin-guanine dinucleotide biosynthesis protein MobA n=1 Tax=Actinomyces oris TaxID=544580 RepID=A0A1Q8VZW5_9ACTO|nr:molybdopterin-guanine dinucleotide biosynthesis protein MobA [Actinomyces oris]
MSTADAAEVADVIVLAGGTGRRLDGVSKPDVVARGLRLLDHVLAGLERLREQGLALGRVCVVAPAEVALPGDVLRALEDPPLGGPVAGIAAGLELLGGSDPVAGLTGILTCDAPLSWRALPSLYRALAEAGPELDGACARDGDHTQYLLGLYRRRALTAAVTPDGMPLRDTAVRRALGPLHVTAIPTPHDVVRDLDTWAEVRAWDSDRCG